MTKPSIRVEARVLAAITRVIESRSAVGTKPNDYEPIKKAR
jgi:hypothetical protein